MPGRRPNERTASSAATPPIRGVLFDVDGTLYHQRRLRLLVAARLLFAALRRPFRTWEEVRILREYRRAQEWLRAHAPAPVTPESQLARTIAVTGLSAENVAGCVQHWMQHVPLDLLRFCGRRDLIRSINRWHALSVPMAVYSDYPASDKLQHLGLATQLAFAVCSTDPDVGTYKPHPRGFRVAASRMGLRPEEVCYVGDRPDVDGVGARNAGMQPLIVRRRSLNTFRKGDAGLTPTILDAILQEAHAPRAAVPFDFRRQPAERPENADSVNRSDR